MIDMWHSILSRFNATSKKLQITNCELKVALNMLCSRVKFLEDMRSRFNKVEARCIAQSGISEYHSLVVRRRKRNTRYDDDTDGYVQEGVILTGREFQSGDISCYYRPADIVLECTHLSVR